MLFDEQHSKLLRKCRYEDAMFWAKQLNDSAEWNKFATALLYSLNVDYGKGGEIDLELQLCEMF